MTFKKILEEFVLLLLIILSVLEFFEILPGEINFFKKILSWMIIGFILYYVSLTKILFHKKNNILDILILISFYFIAFKDLSHFIVNEEFIYLNFLKKFLWRNQYLNEVMFYFGSFIPLFLSIYSGFKINYRKNSILGIIHYSEKKTYFNKIIDTIIIYITLLFFSYFIFTVVIEWFSLAIDSFIIMSAIVYYFVTYFILKTEKGYKSFIRLVGEAGDQIIKSFLGLFKKRETIYFGISGLIVIHALIDLAIFILPYILSIENTIYLSSLSPKTHQTLVKLFLQDFNKTIFFLQKLSIIYI
jgi:hypothetical protein